MSNINDQVNLSTMQATFTSKLFFSKHAPDFNFELDEEQLIDRAIQAGFIKYVEGDKYCYAKGAY